VKILLIANYAKDNQQSMLRFAEMMRLGLQLQGHEVQVVAPKPKFGTWTKSAQGLGKWLGYVDKFLLFPKQLKIALKWADVVHICDHSNSFYTKYLKGMPHVVTCHDLLAVRGALGDDCDCPASITGKVLQRWILEGLKQAQMIICVSTSTLNDLRNLSGSPSVPKSRVVHLGMNAQFSLQPKIEVDGTLSNVPQLDLTRPYILNVGSSIKRKNREGVLRIFSKLRSSWKGQCVFAGEALSADQTKLANDLGIMKDVVQVKNPSGDVLRALYNGAFALLFPSRFEGFGWPIIEAQACGCPVLCGKGTSLPEVAGEGALLRESSDEEGFVSDALRLTDQQFRAELIQRGIENVKRFSTEEMLRQYTAVYQEVCNKN
jgi:glycosyltransferase involved in cell wall biosynthesis